MIEFYILIGVISLASWYISNTLKRKFKKYSKIKNKQWIKKFNLKKIKENDLL